MYINETLSNVKVVCINLVNRPQRRKWIEGQFRRRALDMPTFFTVRLHENPKRGCLESHLAVIKQAVKEGVKHLLVLEDDAKLLQLPTVLSTPPDNWDMLYLGGTVKHLYEDVVDKPWVRMCCWTAHSYILNLQNKKLVSKIYEALSQKGDQQIDHYYLSKIHPMFNCYMANPMICIQKPGFSDIEGREVSYEFMPDTLNSFKKPEHEIQDGAYVLKMPDMEEFPGVTIITPTYNRRKFFALAMHNFEEQNYPSDKLEWIIVDDSDETEKEIDDLVPTGDSRIKHIKLPPKSPRATVAYKRNYAVNMAKYDIIIHMDDDDYYPPNSVMARVKMLLKYGVEGIGCVGCSAVAVYDVVNKSSSIASDGTLTISEASMAYTKSFWREQPFFDLDTTGEYFAFIKNRHHQVLDIPYEFVVFALTHNTNLTAKLRRVDSSSKVKHRDTGKEFNFLESLDEDTQFFLEHFIKQLLIPPVNSTMDLVTV